MSVGDPAVGRPLRLLLVDDHPVVRSGLASMLADDPGLEVVAQASEGAEALSLAARLGPLDVVLMDLRMPVMDGTEATARLCALQDPPAVLVLTTYDTDVDIVRAVEAGARGYLLKDAPTAELRSAIRAAARGETVFAEPVARRLRRGQNSATPPALTARERQVLQAAAAGRTNAQIARGLGIGEATVKTHLLRTFAKLEAPDRTSAVTTAYRLGLIEL